ncbi:MAG: hypothetical protein K9M44_00675 [Candidatus Pacebacteria bacterium]|nr:hypothetical protein [Candidatus Paceibacterota bacterium]
MSLESQKFTPETGNEEIKKIEAYMSDVENYIISLGFTIEANKDQIKEALEILISQHEDPEQATAILKQLISFLEPGDSLAGSVNMMKEDPADF